MAWTNGSYESNRRFWGIECEGGGPNNMGEPLTALQLAALIGVVKWLWANHTPYPFERRVGAWEHNEMTRYGSAPTSCPSGRIPWDTIITALQEEEIMTPEEKANIDRMDKQIQELLVKHNQPQVHPIPPTLVDNLARIDATIAELQAKLDGLQMGASITPTLTMAADGIKLVVK